MIFYKKLRVLYYTVFIQIHIVAKPVRVHVRSVIESPWVELETLSLDEGENPSAIRQF